MLIKRTSSLVIILSSATIICVLALTTFGFYAYLEWKEKNTRRHYRLATYEMNAELFGKYVIIYSQAKIGTEGIFNNRPIVEGTIKNTSNKKIYSLKMKVSFRDAEGHIVFVDTFYPIGTDIDVLSNIAEMTSSMKSFLLEGDSISFTYRLKNCPQKVLDHLRSKLHLAKVKSAEGLEFIHKVEGLALR